MIAVHCGAGRYSSSPTKRKRYLSLTKKACKKGIDVLNCGGTAVKAVREAIKVLEDDCLTNSGYGSNLTLDGRVEDEASIMNGSNLVFGACGVVSQAKNPICLAYDIYRRQLTPQALGLAPVSLLVGDGADRHAKQAKLKIVKNSKLISRKSLRQYKQYKDLLTETVSPPCISENGQEFNEDLEQHNDNEFRFEVLLDSDLSDTVGAVCLDDNGDTASGCSSGGVLLKRPGRLAQSAHYGSGVWADSEDKSSRPSMAVCTTGSGEQLVKTLLAKTIAEDLIKENNQPGVDLHTCMTEKFMKSRYLKNEFLTKLAGALVLKADNKNGEVSLMWTHNTLDMGIGYMRKGEKPHSQISTLPKGSEEGKSINVGGASFYFNNLNRNSC
ncbi:threonine aspartase 1 [Anthonomus grandis grandis]|uniref:threonine aspartase 1 n=1 Tax=Anthonomus grandis grandis TaxID=2921223 RepID=UPI0021651584|nr:threonine aspartase 1 [Anthonomus grandis grandis]